MYPQLLRIPGDSSSHQESPIESFRRSPLGSPKGILPKSPSFDRRITVEIRSYRDETAELQINEIEKEFGSLAGKVFVEIGGAKGHLSKAAQIHKMSELNIEISQDAAKKSMDREVNTFNGTFDEAIEEGIVSDDSADIIACYDLFEHILEPNNFLKQIALILKPDGMLAIRIPCTPKDGPRLHLVDHVYHYSLENLTKLLNKHGFYVGHVHHSGSFVSGQDTIENMTIFARPIKSAGAVQLLYTELHRSLYSVLEIAGVSHELLNILKNKVADIVWELPMDILRQQINKILYFNMFEFDEYSVYKCGRIKEAV
ncbi:MAG: methyltransferase domain-containing protein [Elusimicrobiota bacterium]